jgi:hypothetical protein
MIDAQGLAGFLLADGARALLPRQHSLVILQRDPVVGLEPTLARFSYVTSTFLLSIFGIGMPFVKPPFVDLRSVSRGVRATGCKPFLSIDRVFCISFLGPFAAGKHLSAGQ